MKMMNSNMKISFFSLFLVFQALCSVSAAEDASIYKNFTECLATGESPIPKDQISKIVFEPNNEKFEPLLDEYVRNCRYNTTAAMEPVLIVTPLEESQIPAIVLCAKNALGIMIKVRSGGHDYEGFSYVAGSEFMILDMFNLRAVDVDMATKTAWVQSGATLGELYYRISEKSPVHGFPGGSAPSIGIGGHISGGGYGNMIRRHGLSVDHVVDARFVDAKGRILDRKGMGENVFWALRGGGGGNFGVILAYKINLVQVPKTVSYFRVERTVEQNATDVVLQFQDAVATMDNNLFLRLILRPIAIGKEKHQVKRVQLTTVALFLGDSAQLLSVVNKELPSLGLKSSDCIEMTWIQSVLQWANHDYKTTKPDILLARIPEQANFTKIMADYVITPIPREGLELIWKKMEKLGDITMTFNSFGGKLTEVSDSDTPFPHRSGILYLIQYSISWSEVGSEAEKAYLFRPRSLHEFMTNFVSSEPRRAYLNYRDLSIGNTDNGPNRYEEGKNYGVKYFNKNFDRLVKVKTEIDPENFFRNAQSIPPLKPLRSRKQAAT